jgi:ABC-2 type transport system permease protein
MIKKFYVVLIYELKELMSNKTFVIVTLALALSSMFLLSLPSLIPGIKNAITGEESQSTDSLSSDHSETAASNSQSSNSDDTYVLYDETGALNMSLTAAYFPNAQWLTAKSVQEVSDMVDSQSATAGFVVKSTQVYDYYVYDRSMYDNTSDTFRGLMTEFYRMEYCKAQGISYESVAPLLSVLISNNELVLHADSRSNFFYCYILIIVIFMMIILYGQMIAVSVTSEKSNRAVEILVTSAPPSSLLFGKVIAQAIGGVVQMVIIIGSILLSYQVNRNSWGGMLDIVFQIPAHVLLAFAAFGLGGYLFYAFLFGAMGALVSKTEDISKSSSGLLIIIMGVYIYSILQLNLGDNIINKVLSFLPISSYSAMFMRVATGSAAPWEIVLSFVILVLSIIGAGFLGAKIYRMGTLRYGNPIKFSTAIKSLRHSE